MRCAGAISGPDVRQFALAQRQSGRGGAACSLVPYRTLALSTQRLLFWTPNAAQTGGQRVWGDHSAHPGSWSHASTCVGLPKVVYVAAARQGSPRTGRRRRRDNHKP